MLRAKENQTKNEQIATNKNKLLYTSSYENAISFTIKITIKPSLIHFGLT